jgi:hypothetical protein
MLHACVGMRITDKSLYHAHDKRTVDLIGWSYSHRLHDIVQCRHA